MNQTTVDLNNYKTNLDLQADLDPDDSAEYYKVSNIKTDSNQQATASTVSLNNNSNTNTQNIERSATNSTATTNVKYKNNILNYYFNDKQNMNSTDDLNFNLNNENNSLVLENNENLGKLNNLNTNNRLNYNYSIKNNDIYYTPNRNSYLDNTLLDDVDTYSDLRPKLLSLNTNTNLNATSNNNINNNNNIQTGRSIQNLQSSQISLRKPPYTLPPLSSESQNDTLYSTNQRVNSNLYIDFNRHSNTFSNVPASALNLPSSLSSGIKKAFFI